MLRKVAACLEFAFWVFAGFGFCLPACGIYWVLECHILV